MLDNWIKGLTQNYARYDAESKDHDLRPVAMALSVDAMRQRLESWTQLQSHWSVIGHEGRDGRCRLHLTRKTQLFGFVDDINVEIVPDANGCLVHAESQSRVGKGDFGQNKRNLKELRHGIMG
ncbi:DUF1499 domain-containing protein [Crateriforma spongiae]|uniref:DUF1499 domain-containing protein n=1 Tax=Crateriforma spongiae TaxID=2724528 RepID=UPI0014462D8D|nr:DUF1499 domain-containing protein [Crateriforma spongiae]